MFYIVRDGGCIWRSQAKELKGEFGIHIDCLTVTVSVITQNDKTSL